MSTWLFELASMMSTGSSLSVSTRISSAYDRAGTTSEVSSTGSRIGNEQHRDAVVVSGSESQLVAREPRQHAGQDGPCLVCGCGKDDLRKSRAKILLADARGRTVAGRRNNREFIRFDAPQLRLIAAGLDAQGRRAV